MLLPLNTCASGLFPVVYMNAEAAKCVTHMLSTLLLGCCLLHVMKKVSRSKFAAHQHTTINCPCVNDIAEVYVEAASLLVWQQV